MPKQVDSKKGLNVLFLGDVVGKSGRDVIKNNLPSLRKKLAIDFVVCNAENAAGGFGITASVAREVYDAGVDVITLGDHTWDKPDTSQLLAQDWRMLRPINYPPNTVGKGFHVYPVGDGRQIAVVNLMGRAFMPGNFDCPFQASEKIMAILKLGGNCDAIFVDIHAEATAEKRCLAAIWDGKASFISGTHTHVPTADAHVMLGGTGFQTDAGMCGVYENSSLGSNLQAAVARFTKAGRSRLEPVVGNATMCGTFASINGKGLCKEIRPIRIGGVLRQET